MQPYLVQSSPVLSGLGQIPPPRVLKKREGTGGGMGKLSDFFRAWKFLGKNAFLAKVLESFGIAR